MTTPGIEFYKDINDKWRWRAKASNGRVVGTSAQAYSSKQMCQLGLESFKNAIESGEIWEKK